MRCRVIKHAVDGVAPGGVVELVDNLANRALIAGGVIEPLEVLPPEPPAKAFKPAAKGDLRAAEELRARFDVAWEEAQGQIRNLRKELDHERTCSTVACGACEALPAGSPCAHCDGKRLVPAVAEVDRLRALLAAPADAAPSRAKKGG